MAILVRCCIHNVGSAGNLPGKQLRSCLQGLPVAFKRPCATGRQPHVRAATASTVAWSTFLQLSDRSDWRARGWRGMPPYFPGHLVTTADASDAKTGNFGSQKRQELARTHVVLQPDQRCRPLDIVIARSLSWTASIKSQDVLTCRLRDSHSNEARADLCCCIWTFCSPDGLLAGFKRLWAAGNRLWLQGRWSTVGIRAVRSCASTAACSKSVHNSTIQTVFKIV